MIEVVGSDGPPTLETHRELFEVLSLHRGKTIRIESGWRGDQVEAITVGELIWIESSFYDPRLVVHLGQPYPERTMSSLSDPFNRLDPNEHTVKVLLDGARWHTLHLPQWRREREVS